MPHGHCYFWQSDILWRIVAGEAMHVVAYSALAAGMFYLCTKPTGKVSSWLPPFMFLFACFIFTCGLGHVVNIITIWLPYYQFQSWWGILSGVVSIATLIAVIRHWKQILDALCGTTFTLK